VWAIPGVEASKLLSPITQRFSDLWSMNCKKTSVACQTRENFRTWAAGFVIFFLERVWAAATASKLIIKIFKLKTKEASLEIDNRADDANR